MKMSSQILLTRLCGTWCNEYRVSGSHWRWRMRLQCRHPCSQTAASRPPACQAGCTAPQCGPAHHRSGPKCCRGTCTRQAWVSVRDYWLQVSLWKETASNIQESDKLLAVPCAELVRHAHGHTECSWRNHKPHRSRSTSGFCHWPHPLLL